MRPRARYRTVCVFVPLAFGLLIVGVVSGLWWFAGAMALNLTSGLLSLRAMRRQGIDWHGPTTFRELRALQVARTQRPDDG